MQLIPSSSRDRRFAVLGIFSAIVACFLYPLADDFTGYFLLVTNTLGAIYSFLSAYIFQDTKYKPAEDNYEGAIFQLEQTQKALANLSKFLEGEKDRVAVTEQTLKKLKAEKDELEPVVNTQKETVHAILFAHSKTQRKNVWKDHLFGFILGVLSSIAAAGILYTLDIGESPNKTSQGTDKR